MAQIQLAGCLAAPLPHASVAAQSHPVVLYLDRSASMQGFLDPAYPARVPTDFRSVLDRVVVGLAPSKAFAYGVSLSPIQPSLGAVEKKAFYSDRDTRMEQGLDLIAADTAQLSSDHVIVGDGRRGSPASADAQYVRMRTVADAWTRHGGTFIVAVSMAPFQTVDIDPSGCRRPQDADDKRGEHREHAEREGHDEGESDEHNPQTCPLYAFAFAAPGDALRVESALAASFEHLFAWPAPRIPQTMLDARATASRANLTVEHHWARAQDGTPIARVGGAAFSNKPVTVVVELTDSSSSDGRTYRALLDGEGVRLDLASRPLSAGGSGWGPASGPSALVRQSASAPLALDFTTRGSAAPLSLVRLDLYPTGTPSWLDSVDAVDAHDVLRTYGIGRLFEVFHLDAEQRSAPIARLFFVVN